jgi:hypothetical protein
VLYRGFGEERFAVFIYSLQPLGFEHQCGRTSADSLISQGFANCTVRVDSDDLCGECIWVDESPCEVAFSIFEA